MRKNIMKKLIATVCTVSMVMGSISFTAKADEEALEITKQPTMANPTVEVNKTEGVSYQWYEAEVEKSIPVVDDIVDEAGGRIFAASSSAMYDKSENVWSADPEFNEANSETRFFVDFNIEAGDKLYVRPYAGANIDVRLYGTSMVANSEGVYIYESPYDNKINIGVWEKMAGATVAAQLELERDGKLYKIVDGMKEEFDGKLVGDSTSYYDKNQDLWESHKMVGNDELRFLIYAEENQIINFDFLTPISGYADIMNYSDANYEENVSLDSAENLWVNISENGYYYIIINGDRSFDTSVKIIEAKDSLAVEGQNTSGLTDYEINKLYRCKVTYGNESIYSDYIIAKLFIVSQPTASDPTVRFNYDIDATYQWYNVDVKTYEVVHLGDEVGESQINVIDCLGEYNDGQWNSNDGGIGVAFEVEKGDKVVVILPEDFDGTVEECDNMVDFTYSNGVYEAVINNNLEYIAIFASSDEDFTAKVYVEKKGISESIVGENKATLMNPEYGKSYVCKATYNENEYVSNVVTMTMAPTKQPSLSDLSFKMNFEDKVAAYQWYEVEETVYKVVDSATVTPDNIENIIPVLVATGTYEDGKWKGQSYTYDLESSRIIYFMGEFETNTVLNIQLSVSAIDLVEIMGEAGSDEVFTETDNGLIKYSFPVSGLYAIGIMAKGDYTANMTVVQAEKGDAIEGQTTNRLTKHEPGIYVCEATLTDGTKLYSDIITITEDDDVHAYTDMYDADCNDCGDIREVPERPADPDNNPDGDDDGTGNDGEGDNDSNNNGTGNNGSNGSGNIGSTPDTGDGVNMTWLLALVVAAVVGVMFTSLKKNRA